MPLATSSDALDDEGDPLADADAHRAERVTAAAPVQLVDGRGDQAGAARAERMAERDRAAVGVDARVVVGDAEVAQNREALRGERLVELDHVDLRQCQAGE